MESRTWRESLRGVKIYFIILASISLSLFVVLLHPQPAHAEGFLSKTVRCVVGGLLGADCRTVPSLAPTPTPVPTAPAPSAPTEPQASQSSNASPAPSSQAKAGTVRQPSSAQLKTAEPINIELPDTPEVPVLPATNHRTVSLTNTMSFAFPYGTGHGQSDTAALSAPAAFEPSQEGWRILGVAWYWWVIGTVLTLGVGLLIRRIIKRPLSVAS
jgi:hypothetical protein